jgi:hypothetical protein
MKEDMAELRKILDIFDGTEFTVTYFYTPYYSHSFFIAFEPNSIDIDVKQKIAITSDFINLMEKNGYRILMYRTDIWPVNENDLNITFTRETVYIKIAPIDEKIKYEFEPLRQ